MSKPLESVVSESIYQALAVARSLKKVTASVASLSWIDPTSGLPETDKAGMPAASLSESAIKSAKICRFANLLTVEAWIDGKNRQIIGCSVKSMSGLHWRRSKFNTTPQIYQSQRRSVAYVTTDGWRKTVGVDVSQVVGCRTLAPETVARGGGAIGGAVVGSIFGLTVPGALVGYLAGEEVVEAVDQVFPPIWTELKVSISGDGDVSGDLVGHSLFPSVSWYFSADPASGYTRKPDGFGGVPTLPLWRQTGWGPRVSLTGPSAGSPWNAVDPR